MTTESTSIDPVSFLREDYQRQKTLFNAQPTMIQRYLESQAQRLAQAVIGQERQIRFSFPDRVIAKIPQSGEMAEMLVPNNQREQAIGGWRMSAAGKTLRDALRQRLNKLEQSPDESIYVATGLLRFATADTMISNLLPDGRSVKYRADGDEQIPTIPIENEVDRGSALMKAGDAVTEENPSSEGRGEFHIPYVPAARWFFLPQWVFIDGKGNLLVNSVSSAEAIQATLERYISILHTASSLAPYMVADETYQRKRYGILGQLINQGRSLASFKTLEIIRQIKDREKKGTLNRGLSISMPYFDDQNLKMAELEFEVIPAGRIIFRPVFVIRASRGEQAKVGQDTRLNSSTRHHLLMQLKTLETAFLS